MPSPARRPVAVLLRTHLSGAKVRHSIQALAMGELYDAFVLAREEDGEVLDLGDAPKVSYRLRDIVEMGFRCEDWYGVVHRADRGPTGGSVQAGGGCGRGSERRGEPSRDRTEDPLIKSQML